MSDNVIGADNQQERLFESKSVDHYDVNGHDNIDVLSRLQGSDLGYFLAGFVDGEGSFSVSFAKHPTTQSRWIILTKFQIYQHQNHRAILELFRQILGVGRIDKKSGSDVLSLTVEGRKNLILKIIPFFRRYPLATKAGAFEKFSVIVEMMDRGEHRTQVGFERIVRLAHTMNAEGRFRIYSAEYIIETTQGKLKK